MTAGDPIEPLCRSALYEALALGFRRPTSETVARLATREGAGGLTVAARMLDAERLSGSVRALADADTRLVTLAPAHERLFGHTVRGEVSPYETEYGADELFLQPRELADLGGFYAAFGLAVARDGRERPDHVCCECEFLMFLARKEAVARERGDALVEEETRRATRLFLRDHLGRFVPALAARLERADPGGFYGALGALARAFLARECEAFYVLAGPEALGLRSPVEDRTPMACGSCPLDAPGEAADGD
jgi:DMSO reductase family type II enzyme chaperone